MNKQQIFLKFEDAVSCLPCGNTIHVFMNGGIALIGADWKRSEILELLKNGKVQIGGVTSRSMKHGLCASRDGNYFFIEADEKKISYFDQINN